MRAFGSMMRVVAIRRTSSKISTTGCSSSGVPGIDMRQLMGTLSGGGLNPQSTSSILRRSRSVSPIPMMPPQQTAMPAFWTEEIVLRRSSKVWLETMFG